MLTLEIEVIWLLIVASAVALAVRWVRVPYTVALVMAGIVLGFFDALPDLHLAPGLLFHLFLPILLFEAAFHLQYRELRENAGPVLLLAVPGMLTAAVVSGGALFLLREPAGLSSLSLPVALLFGAMVSATDPISVIAIFRELGVSRRLANIVEGESLFNDGAAVVVFGILFEMIRGGEVSLQAGLGKFLVVVVGGAVFGLALGLIFSRLTAVVDDHLVEITLTTILAFSAYIGAEHFHFSGVISVVLAGLMVGNYGARVGMSPTTRVSVGDFWEYAAFVVNSVIFILVGLEVKAGDFALYLPGVAAAVAVVFTGRTISVGGISFLVNRFLEPFGAHWQKVLVWGGLRGSLSMALALSLPADFPGRRLILTLVFGVVAFSLLVQGLTIKPLLRRWGLTGGGPQALDFEIRRGELLAKQRALEELDRIERGGYVSHETAEKIRPRLEEEIALLKAEVSSCMGKDEMIGSREERVARLRLWNAEKEAVKEALRMGILSAESAGELVAAIDGERETFDADGAADLTSPAEEGAEGV